MTSTLRLLKLFASPLLPHLSIQIGREKEIMVRAFHLHCLRLTAIIMYANRGAAAAADGTAAAGRVAEVTVVVICKSANLPPENFLLPYSLNCTAWQEGGFYVALPIPRKICLVFCASSRLSKENEFCFASG